MARKQPGNTQPFLDHDTLTQREQAKHLGVKEETVMNLGHPVPVSQLTENPAGRMMNYDSGDTARTFRDPPRLQGVYKSAPDPRSGISSERNIDAWSQRASTNSYHGSDPRGRGKGSDNHLLQPKGGYEAGSDSGEGRLEKSEKY
jgi:hypothetical protein